MLHWPNLKELSSALAIAAVFGGIWILTMKWFAPFSRFKSQLLIPILLQTLLAILLLAKLTHHCPPLDFDLPLFLRIYGFA